MAEIKQTQFVSTDPEHISISKSKGIKIDWKDGHTSEYGLRYLRHGDVALAWESARERHLLMHWIAPHLVNAMPFVIPLGEAVSPFIGFLAGTLDDPSWFQPQMDIFVSDAQPWDQMDLAIPKFEQYPPSPTKE